MRLNAEDIQLFYKLNNALLFHVHGRLGLSPKISTLENFTDAHIKTKAAARNELYDNTFLFDEFYEKNPARFTESELSIVLSWKSFVREKFFIYKQYKKFCAFLDEDGARTKIYAVLSLVSYFEELIPFIPCYVETVLLPFKETIIYDGLLAPYNISFGPGIRSNFKDKFDISKAKYGIIDKLPYVESDEVNDVNLLRYYLKTDNNMEYYDDEIYDLIGKDRELLKLYHQELGKRNGRNLARRLKEKGISKRWFAIYEDVIIASGIDKQGAENNAKAIVSSDDFAFVHIFKV